MSKHSTEQPHGSTIAAKAGHFLDVNTGAIVPEIQPSTTFARDDRYQLINAANTYARDACPTYVHAERVIADLEHGEECRLFASGMAAIAAVFYTLKPGNHVVLPDSMYWGAKGWIHEYCKRFDIFVSEYPTDNAGAIEDALQAHTQTQIVWVESPSNPMMHVTDISLAAEHAHQYGALLCVDSTTATPVLCKPLDLGADLVIHSATKFLNGHSDVLAGAVVMREEHELWTAIVRERQGAGAVIGTFEAWLLLRGLRTLYVRVDAANRSAMQIAEYLDQHPLVESVLYPGLSGHPGHDIATRQMQGGYGALLSFCVQGGKSAALAVAGALQLITSATSLGGVETLIEHRHTLEPEANGIPDNLLRLAVGIERCEDLIADLDAALKSIA
ncbi:hypothetical protein AB833_15985 [Chromatiales bacterium (ex Bugula neritina AB1)]|nr:hypothetical protein AB833_15985 [Chromatiales bacterium (ex Bugula neritina AB1)]